jgi:N-dimethylarginine dimethylaminohydrolase
LINSIVEEAAKIAHGEENFAKFFKQMNRNNDAASVAYPRDYSICRGGVFYQTDQRIAKAMSPKEIFSKKIESDFFERLASQKNDLELNGFDVRQDIPFDAKGGNMILTKNAKGESVLLATVSDGYFSDDGVFKGGYIVENGEVVERSDGIFSKVFGSNYPKFCKQIEEWGASIGCDHVVVIERNLSEKYSFKDLYHLDLFCGDLPGGLLFINPEAVSAKNIEQLEGVFGKDKIIEISRQEQNELCANFIVFNRTVVASSPRTPESFIEKMNQAGFDVYVPAIYLTRDQTMKQGWRAGVRCLTTSTDDNPKMIIDLDSAGKNNSSENTSKIGSGLSGFKASQLVLTTQTLGKFH